MSAKARLQFDEIEKVHIVLLPEKGLKLNEGSAEIVKLCDGKTTRREIIAALQKKMPGEDPREVKINCMIFLDDLEEKGILE